MIVGVLGVFFVVLLGICLMASRKLRWPLLAMIAAAPQTARAQGPTIIHVSPTILREHVIRLGMNLGGETYFDSQQILKNLVSQNPGFEGQQWQSVLKCGKPTPTSCTDGNNDGSWPEGFLDGGTYEVITGAAAGQAGAILHSTAASSHVGTTIQFAPLAKLPAANDYIVVRKVSTGHALDGWSQYANGGATITTEFKDLSPKTPGAQAIRIRASGPDQFVALSTYFDTTTGHSYVQLRGTYRIRFRAKGVSGSKSVSVKVQRPGPSGQLFDQTVPLSSSWQDYTFDFNARESTRAVDSVGLTFSVGGGEILLDDVSLEEATSNGTAFRDDVLATLERLRPGVLRYMDSGENFGSSLDNMLAPQMARQRSGFSRYSTTASDVPISLHDFLVLSEKLGAEPWYTMQIGMSTQEAANLMEYLGGPVTSKYGATRAALGHPVPWTQTFPRIHLEYGNEAWNTAQPGATMPDAAAYSSRATTIFQTIRASKYYPAGHFNLIANGQAVYAPLTTELLSTMHGVDTISIGPYNFNTFGDDSSIENIFGPMFAEPQFLDDTVDGYVHQQAHAVATAPRPVHLAVYETNIGTTSGTVSQASVNSTVPSLGAGIASIEHMLLMLRDLNVTVQNTFQIGGGNFHFANTAGKDNNETSPVWAVVVDMGGPTNRVRPSFLAQQLANEAIRSTMLSTSLTGADPTWDQKETANDKFALQHVHELQSFAFSDATSNTMIVMNLSRTSARSVTLAGQCAPQGTVTVRTLTSNAINDTNELKENVKTVTREEQNTVSGSTAFELPPFSMTSFSSSNHGCVPAR